MKMIITTNNEHVFDDLCRNLEEVSSCSPGLRGTSYPGSLPVHGAEAVSVSRTKLGKEQPAYSELVTVFRTEFGQEKSWLGS